MVHWVHITVVLTTYIFAPWLERFLFFNFDSMRACVESAYHIAIYTHISSRYNSFMDRDDTDFANDTKYPTNSKQFFL